MFLNFGKTSQRSVITGISTHAAGSRQHTRGTFPIEMLPESTAAGARAKKLTEINSEAQVVLGPAAVRISAVNMSCSYTLS